MNMGAMNLGKFGSLALIVALAAGCTIRTDDDNDLGPGDGGTRDRGGIPEDPLGQAPAPLINNLKPAAQFSLDTGARRGVVRVNLLGLIDPVTSVPVEFKFQDTLFVTEDSQLKGLKISQSDATNQLPTEIVFVVDNSGSMGEEADTVADKIIAFVTVLQSKGVDARVGVVGVNGNVNGAIDLTSGAEVEAYLKRTGETGTSRTVGFAGTNAAALETEAVALNAELGTYENGIHGIVFAESAFSFRENAQRVFVNITDEATQPANNTKWNTKTLCARWQPTTGTIHTIWSGTAPIEEPETDGGTSSGTRWVENSRENPADLSRCTPGGTIKTVQSDASDLDLTTLPLTTALASSALVEFISTDPNAAHTVTVTVKNGSTADGQTVFEGVTYGSAEAPDGGS